jgi:uroporphyrinogen-III decarboxylase
MEDCGMTKKERFLAAVRLEEPDVVPVAPLMHCRIAHRLLGRSDFAAVFETHQMIGSIQHRGPLSVGVGGSLPEGWGGEQRELERTPEGRRTVEWLIYTPQRTMTGRIVSGMIPHDPLVSKTVEYPIKGVEDWHAYRALLEHNVAGLGEPWVKPVEDAIALMGDEGVPSVGLGPAYTGLATVRGMEQFMVDLFDHPDLMDELFALQRQIQAANVKAFLASASPVAWLDICWATGSNLGAKTFERWALPDVVEAMELVRQVPGKYLGLYTLGRIRDLMPMFADAGVHFVETFEPNEGDITLAEAKRLYGDKLCLMGNFDCTILAFGSVEDARAEARRCLDEAMEGGGYVMVTGDEVPADAKLDNLKAMVETVEKHGRYA